MSEESDYSEVQGGWISWFCSLDGHQYLCEIDEEYIQDKFNLYGIRQKFTHWEQGMKMILQPESPSSDDVEDEGFLEIYQEAADIYGLIHQRYISSPQGLPIMREKYLAGKFGSCPRVLCEKVNLIPIGMSEELRQSRVKLYCPRCHDVYFPTKKIPDLDGAYFGGSFPQLLLMTYPELINECKAQQYVPKIFGFKIYQLNGSKFAEDDKKDDKKPNNNTNNILSALTENNKENQNQHQNHNSSNNNNNNTSNQNQSKKSKKNKKNKNNNNNTNNATSENN